MGLHQSVISEEVSATVVSPQVTDTATQSDARSLFINAAHLSRPSLRLQMQTKTQSPNQLAAEWCESQPV